MSSTGIKKLLAAALAAVMGWVFLRYLLPVCLPFLLAAVLALLAEPLAAFCCRQLGLPRWAAAGIGVTVTLAVVALILAGAVALLARQLGRFADRLPDLEEAVAEGLQSLRGWLLELAETAPRSVQPTVDRTVNTLFEDGSALVEGLLTELWSLATGLLSRLTDSVLGIGTGLLAGYMLSARLPVIRRYLERHLPEGGLPGLKRLKGAMLGWLWAQLKLTGILFGVLLSGFWLLGISDAPLWAAVVAVLDALPVIGAAMLLVPWSVVCFLRGQALRGLGLLAVCAVAVVLRSVLEPKLMGRQLGMDPLVTLGAMYAGYRLWGGAGLLLAPLLAVAVWQLVALNRPDPPSPGK